MILGRESLDRSDLVFILLWTNGCRRSVLDLVGSGRHPTAVGRTHVPALAHRVGGYGDKDIASDLGRAGASTGNCDAAGPRPV